MGTLAQTAQWVGKAGTSSRVSTGSDRILGQGGGDLLIHGPIGESSKHSILSGAEGDDIFLAENVPALKDIVWCGSGFDRVLADSKGVLADNCEKVRLVDGSRAEVLKQEEAFLESLPQAVRGFFDCHNDCQNFFEEQLAPLPGG